MVWSARFGIAPSETAYECLTQIQSTEWSEEDEATCSWCISDIERAKYCKSQTKPELCDIEITWLKSLPERFNHQPKQEWSEEKKQTTKNTHPEEYPSSPAECISPREYGLFKQLQQECIETIEQELYSLGKEHEKDDDPRIKFLKSLRPSWKPNGQQLDCLRHMINVSTVGKIDKQLVQDLYEQLKKL